MDMEKKPSLIRIILFVFLFLVYYIFLSGLIASILSIFVLPDGKLLSDSLIGTMIISILIFGVTPLFYCKFRRIKVSNTLKLHKLSIKNMFFAILVGVLLSPILSEVVGLLSLFMESGIAIGNVTAQETADTLTNSGFLISIMAMAVIPSICEELTFRGMFFHKYRSLKPLQIAIISSLAFGMVHLNIVQGVYTFIMGFCFFYLVQYTGSLFAPIIAHFIVNGGNILLLHINMLMAKPEVVDSVESTDLEALLSTVLYLALAIICSILLFKLFRIIKKSNLKES